MANLHAPVKPLIWCKGIDIHQNISQNDARLCKHVQSMHITIANSKLEPRAYSNHSEDWVKIHIRLLWRNVQLLKPLNMEEIHNEESSCITQRWDCAVEGSPSCTAEVGCCAVAVAILSIINVLYCCQLFVFNSCLSNLTEGTQHGFVELQLHVMTPTDSVTYSCTRWTSSFQVPQKKTWEPHMWVPGTPLQCFQALGNETSAPIYC